MKFYCLIGFCFCLLPLSAHAQESKPNIVMIIADDLGWTDLHTGATSNGNGSKYFQTPTIDKLAQQGMSFTSAYTCPNCAPARAALMTGQYAVRNGIYNVTSLSRGQGLLEPPKQREHIRPEAVTIAETLRAAGYATGHVGKFHVATHAEITGVDGFDVNYGGGKAGDGSPHGYFAVKAKNSGEWNFIALGAEMNPFALPYTTDYVDHEIAPYANSNDPKPLINTPKHLTDATADAAIDFIQSHQSKPFYLNIGFNAVHVQVHSRPDLQGKWDKIKSTDPRHTRADYAALLEGEDQAIARILKALDDKNLTSNTIVIFWSDNGGFAGSTDNTPLRGSKGMFYEGGIRVPLIVRWPGKIRPGAITDAMVSGVDFYPTFAEFAGAQLPKPEIHPLDGTSFAPVLLGKTDKSTRGPIFYHFPGYLDTRAYPCSMIIEETDGKRYKLFYSYEDQHYELYNLTDDLSEKNDLVKNGKATDPDLQIATNLREHLSKWLTETHPLWPTVKETKQRVAMPIEIPNAMNNGNRIARQTAAAGNQGE